MLSIVGHNVYVYVTESVHTYLCGLMKLLLSEHTMFHQIILSIENNLHIDTVIISYVKYKNNVLCNNLKAIHYRWVFDYIVAQHSGSS